MLQFQEDFFLAEERDGFLIESMMKRYWACCMDLVSLVDDVCKKYGLTYYADWGTMLGTVRHGGFIPWDDDIDLMMKRTDYQKLLSVLPKEMPKNYVISSPFHVAGHKEFFSGVANEREIVLSEDKLQKRHGCPFSATIDIYPLDFVPGDDNEETIVHDLFVLLWNAVQCQNGSVDPAEAEDAIRMAEEYCGVKFDRGKPMLSQIWKVANQLVMSYREEEGDYLTEWCTYVKSERRYRLRKEWFDHPVYLPFENMQMPVPNGYLEMLPMMYGDWQTKIKAPSSHDYPVYKDQMLLLQQKMAEWNA